MNEKFYYFRDEAGAPRITVCLIRANGYVARGVAICSDKDSPNKSKGRAIARGRAVQAMHRQATDVDGSQIKRTEAYHQLYRCAGREIPFFFKSTFTLWEAVGSSFHHFSPFEISLLGNEERRAA